MTQDNDSSQSRRTPSSLLAALNAPCEYQPPTAPLGVQTLQAATSLVGGFWQACSSIYESGP
jgi:hypothetical protein